jgi:hypothetical protein
MALILLDFLEPHSFFCANFFILINSLVRLIVLIDSLLLTRKQVAKDFETLFCDFE